MKDKKGTTITNTFQKLLEKWGYEPNKVMIIKGSEFFNRPTKSWLQDNDIKTYSAHTERRVYVVINL